jgi:branched-chain amino acid transport system ATP-binding protein
MGDIRGIIGPNGAGKTTIFNLIPGVYKPDSGAVIFKDENLAGRESHEIIAAGIARTFQNIRLFKSMSVFENVMTAGYSRLHYPLASALLRTKRFHRMETSVKDSAISVLEAFGLLDRLHDKAESLPYGMQRKVELARALSSSPQVLLLDEPGAGMNPAELDNLADLILWIRHTFSLSIILIEHRMQLVNKLCGSVKVLNFGQTIFEGKPCDLSLSREVVKAYFGEDHA